MKVKLVNKIIVSGIEINHNTLFENIKDDKILCTAYELLQNNAYPIHCKNELLKITMLDEIDIIVSNHKKWDKEKRDNPEWFNVL